MEDFVALLKKLLVAEFFCTEEEAEALVKENLSIVTQGIMSGKLRATAMALDMKKE